MKPADYVRDTIDLANSIATRFLELGARLYKIREEKLWNTSFDSYQEFLDSAKLTPGNASILASIHRRYVVEGGINQSKLAGIGYSNLYESIHLIESEGVESAVANAKTLTRGEIKDKVREQKHGEHTHQIGTDRWGACEECGKFIRI